MLSVVGRFSGRGENADDLFQIGCVGLIKAIDNFDTGLDIQLSTYAVPMIIGEIRRYLRDNNMVRVSRSVRDLAYRILQAKEKLLKEKGKEPQRGIISGSMGILIGLGVQAVSTAREITPGKEHHENGRIYCNDSIRGRRALHWSVSKPDQENKKNRHRKLDPMHCPDAMPCTTFN